MPVAPPIIMAAAAISRAWGGQASRAGMGPGQPGATRTLGWPRSLASWVGSVRPVTAARPGSPAWALNFKIELNLKARGGADQGRRGLGALAASLLSGRLVSAGWHEAHGRDQAGPPLPVMPVSRSQRRGAPSRHGSAGPE